MNQKKSNQTRVLGLSPSSRGIGFAVLEGPDALIDWGVKTFKSDHSDHALLKVEDLIGHYQPGIIVVRDCAPKVARCSKRIALIIQEIIDLAGRKGVSLKAVSQAKVKSGFDLEKEPTKHDIACFIAQKFPDELGCRLPNKRRPWMSEDYRMGIFEAVALALRAFL